MLTAGSWTVAARALYPGALKWRFALRLVALVVVTCLASFGASAETPPRAVPADAAQVRLSLAPVVKLAQPAVVNVYASRAADRQQNPLFADPFFREFFGDGGQDSRSAQSLGSGVLVDASGLIVTNEHVIEGMTDVKVALSDRRELPAEIVLRDKHSDLAILRIKGGGDFPVLGLGDSDGVEVGDFVVAIGDPFGVGQTVTQGIISALPRSQAGSTDYSFFLQTDAAINPGNSGGALVDMSGKLVGINSAIYSRSGGSVGIGFAIPVNIVKAVVAAAKSGGKVVKRPWLGASLQAITPDIAEFSRPRSSRRSLGRLRDPWISGRDRRPEERRRDQFHRHAIDRRTSRRRIPIGHQELLGGEAQLGVRRGRQTLNVDLALSEAPETPPRDPLKISSRSPFSGALIWNLSPAVLDELQMQSPDQGVVIADIAAGSVAANLGLRRGDVVEEVNGKKIATTRDLERVAADRAQYWDLAILRDGQIIRTEIWG